MKVVKTQANLGQSLLFGVVLSISCIGLVGMMAMQSAVLP